jgi:hypothetical protein
VDDRSTGSTLRYDSESGYLVVGKEPSQVEIAHNGVSSWVGRIEDIGTIKASRLQQVLRRANDDQAEGNDGLTVIDGEPPDFDADYVASDVEFIITSSHLAMTVVVGVDESFEHDPVAVLRQIARPLLERAHAEILSAEIHYSPLSSPWACSVEVAPAIRGKSVGELFVFAKNLIALLDAASSGSLGLWSAVQLVLAGRADVLIGQPEGQWIDAKSQDYDLSNEAGKISLAQDVARFANGESGGAIVIGMRTKKRPSGELITALSPIPESQHGTRRHQRAIDQRVFPPPDGLTVSQVKAQDGVIFVVHVPPQPEEHKPFLVQGAIVNGKVEGAFISILRRRGEESIPITAASIHATLSAGRALLRRGQLPPGNE